MYVTTGATGNIGKVLVESLCRMGLEVRAVGRDEQRLRPAVQQGAQAFIGDVHNVQSLTRAFAGATVVFTLIPPDPRAPNYRAYQNSIVDSFVQAIRGAGVKSVVNLSSLGAQIAERVGPVGGFYDAEHRLDAISGLNILHLRPGYFMENNLMGLELIKAQGIFGTPIEPQIAFPMIAAGDVGAYAAMRMAAMDFSGTSVQELFGERDLSMAEVTRIMGAAIGNPGLPYIQFAYDEAKKAILGMGASDNVADMYVELYRSINEGILRPTQPRSPATTTPTSFEKWTQTVFLPIYRS